MISFSNKTLNTIITCLEEQVFDNTDLDTSNFPTRILTGQLKHFTSIRNGNYYTEIHVRCWHNISKEKRDILVSILKERNVNIIAGNRMQLSVRTRSLAFNFKHFVKSKNVTSKFNL